MLSFKSGSVELISNNNDDIPDVIKLWSTTDKIFSGYSDGVLYFKNTTFTINLDDVNVKYKLMNGGGIEILPEKITNDSICSVAEVQSLDGSYTYYNIWVRKKIVSGYIKSLSLSDAEITIGEQELKLSKEFSEAGANGIYVGMEVMAYVNVHNEVAYTKSNSVSNQLGYIIRTYPDEDDETTYVKIFAENGDISDYRVYEKIEIDGTRYNEITAKSAIDSQLTVDRLCVFTTNNVGEIRKINFAKANNSTNAAELNNGLFKVGAVPTSVYKSAPRTLNSGKVILSTDFILFKIPSDLNDYRLYKVSKDKFANDATVANLTAYNRDRGKMAVSIGVQGVSNLNSGAGGDVYYVNDIREEWLDGYEQYIIEYYDGIKQTLKTAVVDDYSYNVAAGLTVGDGFRATVTSEGKLLGIVKACSPKNDTVESSYNTGFNNISRVVKGNVEKIEDKLVKLSGRDEIFNFDNTVVYVLENNKLRKGEFREILSSENIGSGSKIFIYQKYAENKSVVIVK